MRKWLCILYIVLLTSCPAAPQSDGKAEDYLTDGKLKGRIEVRILQGGFAGFTGRYWAIEPDGSWSTGEVLPRGELKPSIKGKLSGKELADLADELAQCDLVSLPSHGKPVVNPSVTEVRFGKATSVLQPERGDSSRKEDKAIRARYDRLVRVVKKLCK